jgi:hypothetical protein
VLRLALLAALGIVLELFVVEEELLACRKNELGAAVDALEYSIGEFHGRLPQSRDVHRNRPLGERLAGPGSLFSFVLQNKSPGRLKRGAASTMSAR